LLSPILDRDARSTPPPPATTSPIEGALAKAGALLVDLAEQATKLGVFVADHPTASTLAGSLCRRADLARQIGKRIAVSLETDESDATTLVNDAILALDGVAVDVEYAAELASETKIKNQIARARLAVTTAGCAIDEARHAVAKQG
jgi:hypothetical protein